MLCERHLWMIIEKYLLLGITQTKRSKNLWQLMFQSNLVSRAIKKKILTPIKKINLYHRSSAFKKRVLRLATVCIYSSRVYFHALFQRFSILKKEWKSHFSSRIVMPRSFWELTSTFSNVPVWRMFRIKDNVTSST